MVGVEGRRLEADDERQGQRSQLQGDLRTEDQVGKAVARKSSY